MRNKLLVQVSAKHFKDKTQSEEVRLKISEQNKGMSIQELAKGFYISDVYYLSVSEASRITKYATRIIRKPCHS